jgi:hypothetical protein
MLGLISLVPIREKRMVNTNVSDGISKKAIGYCVGAVRGLRDWFKNRWLLRGNHYYGSGTPEEYLRIEYKKDWERLHRVGRPYIPNIFDRG